MNMVATWKQAILSFLFICIIQIAYTQINQWTWMHGDNAKPFYSQYGKAGYGSTVFKPGAREGSISWIDASGNLLLFGGYGNYGSGVSGTGYYNDFWKYNTSTGVWTWVNGDIDANAKGIYGSKGISAPTNKPGGRCNSLNWKDTAGNYWLFGGYGYALGPSTGFLNDLWCYNVMAKEWVWVSGDSTINNVGEFGIRRRESQSNKPSARENGIGWTDNVGNIWLFGGKRISTSGNEYLNDMWKYNISTANWTWMNGDSLPNQTGIYGQKSIGSSTNKPGSRTEAICWPDSVGNLWMFGGFGMAVKPTKIGSMNDLWSYNITNKQWTWENGDTLINGKGAYGIKGNFSLSNKPGSRHGSVGWKDGSGDLWLFGGKFTFNQGQLDVFIFNDLWKYDIAANKWAWIKGDSLANGKGEFGTLGVSGWANNPKPRSKSISWPDRSGNQWIYGGFGLYSTDQPFSLNDLWKYNPVENKWTWIKGDSLNYIRAEYGEIGVPSPKNKPGPRKGSVSWSDTSGNLWLFSGYGYKDNNLDGTGYFSDLWKYDTKALQWTWIKGSSLANSKGVYETRLVANSLSKPGGREGSISWTDGAGNFWLFGGFGFASNSLPGYLNDLWKFNQAINKWTWVNGDTVTGVFGKYGLKGLASTNFKPGARKGCVSWKDASGNLWLFGGKGFTTNASGYLNDLWKYNPVSNKWTWFKGDSTTDRVGDYGTRGVASPNNRPSSREGAVGWTDGSGNLWLFGGFVDYGFGVSGSGYFNDLWKYNPVSNKWIWIKGDSTVDMYGSYGTKGSANLTNEPGSRNNCITMKDSLGNFWLFGGYGFASDGSSGDLNDLWKYNPKSSKWTWVSGDNIVDQYGMYGFKKNTATTNQPGTRYSGIGWIDNAVNLWMYGGSGYSMNNNELMNDLWKFSLGDIIRPSITCPSSITTSTNGSNCSRAIAVPNPVYSDNLSVQSLTWAMTGATTLTSSQTGISVVGTKTFNAGTTLITYTVMDSAGNSNQCSFSVLVNTTNACKPASTKEIERLENKPKDWSVFLLPNPTMSSFSLNIISAIVQPIDISVYDVSGKKMEQMKLLRSATLTFGEHYSKGSYMIEVRQGEKRVTLIGTKL